MNILQKTGARIKQLRQERLIKQTTLAGQLQISVQTLSAIENGKCDITLKTLEQLSKVLNTTISYVIDPPATGMDGKEGMHNNLTQLQQRDAEIAIQNKTIIVMQQKIIELLEKKL